LDQSPQPTTEPSVDKSDVSMKDDSFIYCPFHFSGAARVIKTNNESNGTTGTDLPQKLTDQPSSSSWSGISDLEIKKCLLFRLVSECGLGSGWTFSH
jgi:hypothetical protein